MLYRFNSEELTFDKIKSHKLYFNTGVIFVVSLFIAFSFGRWNKIQSLTNYEKEILLINMNHPPFSEVELIGLMEDLDIKFPHIVLAQAQIESGTYTSGIFRSNHNLFGLKEAQNPI